MHRKSTLAAAPAASAAAATSGPAVHAVCASEIAQHRPRAAPYGAFSALAPEEPTSQTSSPPLNSKARRRASRNAARAAAGIFSTASSCPTSDRALSPGPRCALEVGDIDDSPMSSHHSDWAAPVSPDGSGDEPMVFEDPVPDIDSYSSSSAYDNEPLQDDGDADVRMGFSPRPENAVDPDKLPWVVPQRRPGAAHASAPRRCRRHIFVDSSNIAFMAKNLFGLGINVPELARLLEAGTDDSGAVLRWTSPDEDQVRFVAGSGNSTKYWDQWGDLNYRLDWETTLREQRVDAKLQAAILTLTCAKGPAECLVLATGDGNDEFDMSSFATAARRALEHQWMVEIWSWKKSLSSKFQELLWEFPGQLKICPLDPYMETVTAPLGPTTHPCGSLSTPGSPTGSTGGMHSPAHLAGASPAWSGRLQTCADTDSNWRRASDSSEHYRPTSQFLSQFVPTSSMSAQPQWTPVTATAAAAPAQPEHQSHLLWGHNNNAYNNNNHWADHTASISQWPLPSTVAAAPAPAPVAPKRVDPLLALYGKA
eukprot:m.96784 g.96784  ORF g.96784 m.96784 type:complete len:538 (+) comp8804_c0_seq1:1170-2783(+)